MAIDLPEGTTAHPVNKRRENRILVSVWDFSAVFPQSERGHYICNDHPAKMRPCLARAILQLFGESPVLDPMAGIGTTLVEAMLLGMDAVGIEYEKTFVDQAKRNISHVVKSFRNRNLGKAVCIRGDAKNLSCLNTQKVGSVVFSPPYFDAIECVSTGHQGPEGGHLQRQHRLAREGRSGYGSKQNVGHLRRYGFGSIVFSPPYYGVMDAKRHVGGISSRDESLARTCSYSKDETNLGNSRNYGTTEPTFMRLGLARSADRTYLEQMLTVYIECHRVLRPGKFMVVVVKDIRRKNLTIPLGADTIKLCQLAGFELFDIIVNKMYFPSFRVLDRAIKDQGKGILHPLKTHEYVLVFKKQYPSDLS
jgi:tRNA G10  N-methylase Trm11